MFENKSAEETIKILKSDAQSGLSSGEAAGRLAADGRNELKEKRRKTLIESFFEQLNDPLIYVLIAAAVVSVILKEISDSVIIGTVVMINALVGMIQEGKARKALDSLKKLTSPHATVIRDGVRREIPASELVVGDIVCLDAGCSVPADLRLFVTENLKLEESALTGEALPVEKNADFVGDENAELAIGDRKNMAYMSTMVTYGRGEGVVTATGMNTEIGKIASLITDAKDELTPLQKRLGELGTVLSVLSLGLCAILFVIAVLQKRNIFDMLVTAISLAVAAVPEGLPAVVTICLALSVTRMVKVNTIVRKLPSVETLGAVSVVCSDKTGTLTQNKMTVEKCFIGGRMLSAGKLSDDEGSREFLQALVLCNDASIEQENRVGDPTELALLDLGQNNGILKERLEYVMPRCGELAFDSDRKMMTTLHEKCEDFVSYRCSNPAAFSGNGRDFCVAQSMGNVRRISYTKGAPDEILKRCTQIRMGTVNVPMTEEYRRKILEAVRQMSGEALRTLAAAMKNGTNVPSEEGMVFLGVAGMKDPARPEAAEAVATFKRAGVRTVMITGDHVDTAFAIGKQLGIVSRTDQCMTGAEINAASDGEFMDRIRDTRVFARVSPAQKVKIVDGFKRMGEIVAMTGDGINDAPSLKAADIGIAMGMTGTDVAKQASDMILTDDNFATIEKAIEEGRGVYENIRKSVIFLLSSNLGEILTMFIAVVCGMASPLKSSHILWINLITDSLPALALGVDINDGRSLMENSPRRSDESLFSRGGLACTCFYGALIAAISLTAFLLLPCARIRSQGFPVTIGNLAIVLKQDALLARAQTYAFTVLGMSQLFHAVGMRDVHKSFFRMNHLQNKLMIIACVVGFLLQFAVTNVSFLINAFGTSRLAFKEWVLLSILAAFPLLAHEIAVLAGNCIQLFKKSLQ